jgi:hypothetical protein
MVGEGPGQIRIHANYTWSSSHSRKPGTVWCNAATIETSINSSIDFIKNISNYCGPGIAILSNLVLGGEISDNLTLINIAPVQGLKDIAPSSKGHISVK